MHIKVHNNKNILDSNGMAELKKFTSKLKQGEEFYLKLMTKKKFKDEERSAAQNRYYHKVIMYLMVMYCPYLEGYSLPDDQRIVHKIIKMYFCNLVRDDLIEVIKYKHPITGRLVVEAQVPSWSFHSMPQSTANEMLDFCKKEIEKYSGVDFDEAVRSI